VKGIIRLQAFQIKSSSEGMFKSLNFKSSQLQILLMISKERVKVISSSSTNYSVDSLFIFIRYRKSDQRG